MPRNLHHLRNVDALKSGCQSTIFVSNEAVTISLLSFVKFNELIKVNFSCFANCLVVSLCFCSML